LACVAAAYILGGFFLAPVIVKWQLEKQVQQRLGHQLVVGEVHINPLKLTAEINHLDLRDPAGGKLIAFRRLFVDFELRSVIDRAWTFSEITLEQPAVNVELDKEGRLNFLALIEALRDPARKSDAPLPRLLVRHVTVTEGHADFRDRQVATPLITRLSTIAIEFTDLSTLPSGTSPYQLSARTTAGASIQWSGELALNPLGSTGKFTVTGLKVATLAHALHGYVAVAAPAGDIDLAADYRFAYAAGSATGGLDNVRVAITAFSLAAPGAKSPLLALESIKFEDGQADFSTREIKARRLVLAKGQLALEVDAGGRANWQALLPAGAPAPRPATPSAAEAKSAARDAPWRVAVEQVDLTDLAMSLTDSPAAGKATVAALSSSFAANLELGAQGMRFKLDHPKVALSKWTMSSGDASATSAGAALESLQVSGHAAGSQVEIGIGEPTATLASVALRQADRAMDAKNAVISGKRLSIGVKGARTQVGVQSPRISVAGLALKLGADGVDAENATFASTTLSLTGGGADLQIAGDGAHVVVSGVVARQGGDRLEARSAEFKAGKLSVSGGDGTARAARLIAVLEDAGVTLSGARMRAASATADLLRVRSASIDAKSLTLSRPSVDFDVNGDGIAARLSEVTINDPRAGPNAVARFDRADLAGGSLRLRERRFSADSIVFAGGAAQVEIDKAGALNRARILGLMRATAPTRRGATANTDDAWRIVAKTVELKNFSASLADRRQRPPVRIALEKIAARLDGLDTGSQAMAHIEFRTNVKEGGEIAFAGKIRPATGDADVQVKVSALALVPAQPYLAQVARLTLASGTLSAQGRLRIGGQTADAKIAYEGSAGIDKLRIDESGQQRALTGWDSVTAADIALTISPDRLNIAELRVNGPVGALLIAQDHTLNVSKAFTRAKSAPSAPAPSAQGAESV
ncbi:MAG: DUF748 domain-containing protein, partial [Betaproteobacteria bacterium]